MYWTIFVFLSMTTAKRKYRYLMLHKVGGDLVRSGFEKRRLSPDRLTPLNQYSQLPRKQKKRLCLAHRNDMARRKGWEKLHTDIKRVKYFLSLEANIRRLRRCYLTAGIN